MVMPFAASAEPVTDQLPAMAVTSEALRTMSPLAAEAGVARAAEAASASAYSPAE